VTRAGGRPESRGLGCRSATPASCSELTTIAHAIGTRRRDRVNHNLPCKIQEQHRAFFPDGKHITEEARGRAGRLGAR